MNKDKIVKYTARFVLLEVLALFIMLNWTVASNVKHGGGIPLFSWEALLFAHVALAVLAVVLFVFLIIAMLATDGLKAFDE